MPTSPPQTGGGAREPTGTRPGSSSRICAGWERDNPTQLLPSSHRGQTSSRGDVKFTDGVRCLIFVSFGVFF